MAGLDPAIHAFSLPAKNVDARDKPGHDGMCGGDDDVRAKRKNVHWCHSGAMQRIEPGIQKFVTGGSGFAPTRAPGMTEQH